MLDTDDLVYDVIQQVCHNHGGFLPEPRDEAENQFLDSLGTDMFMLGMTDRDVEGQWVWDSDGSPVTWKSWVKWSDPRAATVPNGGRVENCALMLRQSKSESGGHRSDGWRDADCNSDPHIVVQPISLICEKHPGKLTPDHPENRH